MQATVSNEQAGDGSVIGRFYTPVIVQPHMAFTLTAQVDSRIEPGWDTRSTGSMQYRLRVSPNSWATPSVEQIQSHDEAGTFRDQFSVTYRNDTDASQEMMIVQLLGAYAFTAPVPEPSTWLMFGAGALVLTGFGRRRRQG